jgi:hypothetical protein
LITEPDNFGGYNNTFHVPDVPYPDSHPPNDFDEDTELESVAAVESIADTASEADIEAEDARSNGEPELIDVDEVILDPDYEGEGPFSNRVQKSRRDPTGVEQPSHSNLSVSAMYLSDF